MSWIEKFHPKSYLNLLLQKLWKKRKGKNFFFLPPSSGHSLEKCLIYKIFIQFNISTNLLFLCLVLLVYITQELHFKGYLTGHRNVGDGRISKKKRDRRRMRRKKILLRFRLLSSEAKCFLNTKCKARHFWQTFRQKPNECVVAIMFISQVRDKQHLRGDGHYPRLLCPASLNYSLLNLFLSWIAVRSEEYKKKKNEGAESNLTIVHHRFHNLHTNLWHHKNSKAFFFSSSLLLFFPFSVLVHFQPKLLHVLEASLFEG